MKTLLWSLAVAASLALPLTANAKDDPKALADALLELLSVNVGALKDLNDALSSDKKACPAAGKEAVGLIEQRTAQARKLSERLLRAQAKASKGTLEAASRRAESQMGAKLQAMGSLQAQWAGTAARFAARCPAESRKVNDRLLKLQAVFDEQMGGDDDEDDE